MLDTFGKARDGGALQTGDAAHRTAPTSRSTCCLGASAKSTVGNTAKKFGSNRPQFTSRMLGEPRAHRHALHVPRDGVANLNVEVLGGIPLERHADTESARRAVAEPLPGDHCLCANGRVADTSSGTRGAAPSMSSDKPSAFA